MILYPEMVLVPIQAIIEECLITKSFVDLSMYIPQDLMCRKESIRRVIEDFVIAGLTAKKDRSTLGYLVLDADEIFFFSNQMAKDIEENIMRSMIKVYAMERVVEEEEMMNGIDNNDEGVTQQPDGITREQSKGTKGTGNEAEKRLGKDRDVVPLHAVVAEISNRYPALSKSKNSKDGDGDVVGKGVISHFCSIALYTERFREMCSNAVKAELIIRSKKGVYSRRDQSAATFTSVDASFEDKDCFATSCYLLQMLSKFSLSTDSVNDELNSDGIRNDFLLICANFARRVTQFALYKHGVDDNIFCFSDGTGDSEFFYSPVNISIRSFKNVFLTCIDDNEGHPQDPISLLRESLPGNVGVIVAQMWVLVGEYHCSNSSFGQGDPENFLLHVKEHCL